MLRVFLFPFWLLRALVGTSSRVPRWVSGGPRRPLCVFLESILRGACFCSASLDKDFRTKKMCCRRVEEG